MSIWQKFAEKLGLSAEETKQLQEELAGKKQETTPAVPEVADLVHNKKAIESLVALVESLKSDNESLRKEVETAKKAASAYETEKAERERILQEEKQKQQKQKAEAKLKEAIEAGRIPAANEELKQKYLAMLEQDLEGVSTIIDAIPSATKKTDTTTKPSTTTSTTTAPKGKSFEDLLAAAREEMKVE